MKEEGIKIRIDSKLKEEFRKICDQESVTMSDKIHDFIFREVDLKKIKSMDDNFIEIVKQMGYENIYIVDSPHFYWNHTEKEVSSFEEGGVPLKVATYSMSILDFLEKNSDKTILLYLNGCDFSNNVIKGCVYKYKTICR